MWLREHGGKCGNTNTGAQSAFQLVMIELLSDRKDSPPRPLEVVADGDLFFHPVSASGQRTKHSGLEGPRSAMTTALVEDVAASLRLQVSSKIEATFKIGLQRWSSASPPSLPSLLPPHAGV